MTKKHFSDERDPARMERAVKYLQDYMATYDKQEGWRSQSDATLIDDVLYGLGVALYGQECEYAPGYEKFQDKLREFLGCHKTVIGAWVQEGKKHV